MGEGAEFVNYQKILGKSIEKTNQIIQQAKVDGVEAIEPDTTWESVYEFDKVVLMNTRLKVYYKEYNGRGWENKVDETNLTQDRLNDFQDTKYILAWIRRSIKKGYTRERQNDVKQQKIDVRDSQM